MATWQALHDYVLNELVMPTTDNGYGYICSVAGKSGATEPSWGTTFGGTTTGDGGCSWECSWDAWDWVQSSSPNGSFTATRLSPTVRSNKIAGYQQTRAQNTKDRWNWKIAWEIVSSESFQYIFDFFHAHRGGQLFYMTWLSGLFGMPDELVTATPGGVNPFDSEVVIGYGEGPTILCRFVNDDLTMDKLKHTRSRWSVSFEVTQV